MTLSFSDTRQPGQRPSQLPSDVEPNSTNIRYAVPTSKNPHHDQTVQSNEENSAAQSAWGHTWSNGRPSEASQTVPSVSVPVGQSQHVETADDDVWARNLERLSSIDGTDNVETTPSTSISLQRSDCHARKRVRFGDEPIAHSLFPHMAGHAELAVNVAEKRIPKVDWRSIGTLPSVKTSYPYASAPWLHADCQEHLDLLSHLSSTDQYFLYSLKKVFDFPQRSVADVLLRIFFESVYPLFPIVDRQQTAHLYTMLYGRRPSSPLLFQSIFFIACQFTDESVLRQSGFSSVWEAKMYFFENAKTLYSFDCEPDHQIVVQSLILLSYWWADYTEEKDMKYWISCAVNLALTMGLHKTVSQSLNMSTGRRRLWRRIFWTIFVSIQSMLFTHPPFLFTYSLRTVCPKKMLRVLNI